MKHANISIFIPHLGCPFACSFCAQNTISGAGRAPTPEEVEATIAEAFGRITDKSERAKTEIAFFGGSFTAIPRDYMTSVLTAARGYLGEGGFKGIRVSTRPDCIDDEVLTLLKGYGVTAIELGAQSMDDDVLSANKRGHTAEDVERSSALIRSYGFELGLQMMTGLYKSSPEGDLETGRKIAALSPDTVRIYPTVIIRHTLLGRLYEQREYVPYSFDECINVCARLLGMFGEKNIRVIRLGLHAERSLEKDMIGGFYPPALGELVRSELVRQLIDKALEEGHADAEAPKRMMSILYGHKHSNRVYFSDMDVSFSINDGIPDGCISVNGNIHEIM